MQSSKHKFDTWKVHTKTNTNSTQSNAKEWPCFFNRHDRACRRCWILHQHAATYTPIQQTDSQSDTLLSQQIHWVSTRNINTWMLTTITTPKQGYRQQNHNSININFNSNINGIISKRKCKCNQKRGKTKHTHEKRTGTRRELMFSLSTHKTNEERKRDSWAQLKKAAIISGSVVCVWVYWEREKESKILFIHHS